TFESNGGSVVTDLNQAYNSAVVAPAAPTKLGNTFGGWYSDAALATAYTFTTMPANNITLYAKWTVNNYTISFEENGGSIVTDLNQAYNSAVVAPAAPTKLGYTFGGWYSDVGLTIDYTFTTMPANNITLYAKWNNEDYAIQFECNGGLVIDDLMVPYGETISNLSVPIRQDYIFDGWYLDIELTIPFNLTQMPSHQVKVYAKWVSIIEVYQKIDLDYAKNFALSLIVFGLETGQYTENHPIKLTLLNYIQLVSDAQSIDVVLGYLNQLSIDLGLLIIDEPTPVELINAIRQAMKSALQQSFNEFTIIAESYGDYPFNQLYLEQVFDMLDAATLTSTAVPIMIQITFDSIVQMMMTLDLMTHAYVSEYIDILYNLATNVIDVTYLNELEKMYQETILLMDYVIFHTNILEVQNRFIVYLDSRISDASYLYKAYNLLLIANEVKSFVEYPNYTDIYDMMIDFQTQIKQATSVSQIDEIVILFYGTLNFLIPDHVYIYFETFGGSTIDPLIGYPNDPVIEPTPPTKEGYVFAGWYNDETYWTHYEFNQMPNISITVYAKWEQIPIASSVSIFIEQSEIGVIYQLEVVELFVLDVGFIVADYTGALLVLIYEGFIYEGFTTGRLIHLFGYRDENGFMLRNPYNSQESIHVLDMNQPCPLTHQEITIEAFHLLDATDSNNWLQPYEIEGILRIVPEEGYNDFDEHHPYFVEGLTYFALDSIQLIVKDIDQTSIDTLEALVGKTIKIRLLTLPLFNSDGSVILRGGVYMVETHVFYEILTYYIHFETNGGEPIDELEYTDLEQVEIPIPIRIGYSFLGWYFDVECTQPLENLDYGDHTLYAKWEVNTYTITFIS
ncbi:MAG: InlB B-repeat-containing protein, partial [Acholeplasmataceae bacterium]|nr:InlB B-repeat-containing protein [Acholeplasmataceae bacterium]